MFSQVNDKSTKPDMVKKKNIWVILWHFLVHKNASAGKIAFKNRNKFSEYFSVKGSRRKERRDDDDDEISFTETSSTQSRRDIENRAANKLINN